jgi:RNA polymerase sigma-70 factor (ECF subfamily)
MDDFMANAQEQALGLTGLDTRLDRPKAETDNDLVREFMAGNDAAFTQLVTRYKDSLTNYLATLVSDYDTAVDLSQEAFLRVYKHIGRYSNVYQFSTWLYRIATNLAIDEMRYRKRRGQVFRRNVWNQTPAEGSEEMELELPDSRLNPRDEVLRKEHQRVVSDAIRSLPEKYRTAFVMKEVQELPYETIAEVLRTSPGTIKSRLHRARELLQRKLENYI